MNSRLSENVHGILLVDKPQGLSSNAVLQRVKHLLGAKKAGHTGSLDPLATGMLPVCLGEATKVSQFLLEADKTYDATGLLGIKTNTADAMGEVISRVETFDVSEIQLRAVLSQFMGTTQQTPSMFSALKHQGKPLYDYARRGIDIPRPPREITIHDLSLHMFDSQQFYIRVRCSKGSYIRNLVEDIGEALGCGAHVTQLRRIQTAGFSPDAMVTLDALAELTLEARRALLRPMDCAIEHLPAITLTLEQADRLRQGQAISTSLEQFTPGIIRVYENLSGFIGLGEWINPQELKAKRLLSSKL
jgi:tRNA pseudouridine55 synthase